MRAQRKPRSPARPAALDAGAWTDAALEALAGGGIAAVRVEPLAKTLGVTKGSFYWHFADRRALLDAMLARWADGRVAAIREQAADSGAPAATLRRLADLYIRRANLRGLAIELAIRTSARSDAATARAVAVVDRERLRHVAALFAGLGWNGTQARARAVLFYSYLFGQSLLTGKLAGAAATDAAIDTLLARAPEPADRVLRKTGVPIAPSGA